MPVSPARANWTCVMKLITHMHAHTHTRSMMQARSGAAVRSRAAEFITAIYYPRPYQGKVISRRLCDASAAPPLWSIMRPVTEMEQRPMIDVGAGVGPSLLHLLSGASDHIHKMAAQHQHGAQVARRETSHSLVENTV